MGRTCADCDYYCDRDEYTSNQWRKSPGYSRCIDCVNATRRYCSECGCSRPSTCYSDNQWYKGPGVSRCRTCVNRTYSCPQCGREFQSRNSMEMHMQVHRLRTVACPICGDRRFKSGANAVQHVENGGCSQCGGGEYAREQIWRFVAKKKAMRRFLTELPMITYYGDYDSDNEVPDYPYKCPQCSTYYRNLSQLLQHQDQKHGVRHAMLTNH